MIEAVQLTFQSNYVEAEDADFNVDEDESSDTGENEEDREETSDGDKDTDDYREIKIELGHCQHHKPM